MSNLLHFFFTNKRIECVRHFCFKLESVNWMTGNSLFYSILKNKRLCHKLQIERERELLVADLFLISAWKLLESSFIVRIQSQWRAEVIPGHKNDSSWLRSQIRISFQGWFEWVDFLLPRTWILFKLNSHFLLNSLITHQKSPKGPVIMALIVKVQLFATVFLSTNRW